MDPPPPSQSPIMPTRSSRSTLNSLVIGFLCLQSVSSFVVCTTRRTTENSLLRNTALDELLAALDNPQVNPLPGRGFCNYLYHIQDGENEVRRKLIDCSLATKQTQLVVWVAVRPVRRQDILRHGHAPATYVIRCSRSVSVRESSGTQNNIAFKEWSIDGIYEGNNS
jgi:hypothetical protein